MSGDGNDEQEITYISITQKHSIHISKEDDWRNQAACKGKIVTDYIPPEKKDSKNTIHYDKTTCQSCPVKKPCLLYALENRAEIGLWGGTTPKQREKHYKKFRRRYELDLDYLLGFRNARNSNNPIVDHSGETFSDSVFDIMADNPTVYITYEQNETIQGSLFEGY